jgi:hypothetical protein
MPKYYRVDEDDFEALPFYSDMDEGWEGHALIVEEQFKEEFIAEQVGRFTRHLLSILREMPTRGEHNPFNRIASKYPREHSQFYGDYIVCPKCRTELDEEEWNAIMDDMRPCCPVCEYEFEMEEEK